MEAFLSGMFRPLLLLLLFAVVVIPLTMLLWRVIPDGKIKRFLFKRR